MSTKARLQSTCMVAFSPDGRLQASGSWDGAMRLGDVGNHQALATRRGPEKTVESVAFSPDGKILASASDDKTLRLWDLSKGPFPATVFPAK